MNLREIYYRLSPNMRLLARKIYYRPMDIMDSLRGKRNKYVPPKGDIFIGSGDFEKQGNRQLDLLKKYIFLKNEDSILDIGCGIGRTAIPLTKYLNKNGRYEGFDVVEKGIKWCNSRIKKDFPNFNFTYVPLENDLYNNSKNQASKFVFPYENDTFHKVFLFSVFTHMQIDEIENYLKEIERVLKPDGYCLATFFIYNEKTEKEISDKNKFAFPVKKDGYRLMDEKVKSANVAISESKLEEMISNTNLSKINLIHGYWKSKKDNSSDQDFQDMLVLKLDTTSK